MYGKIISLSPIDLLEYLEKNFFVQMPDSVISIEDMNEASQKLLKLSSNYSFLCSLLSYVKVECRQAKREKSKEEYENLVDKKEIISNLTDAVKFQYNSISRAVTINCENHNELRMMR